jgi:hypothetical protein
MANYNDRLKDYVQVNERIIKFYEKYPEGSLRSEMLQLTDTLVVFKAYAFRHPGDLCPAIGHSSLGIPGTTPYTEGSEIENAETSAWGRALAALGFEVKRGVASRDEIENKTRTNGEPIHKNPISQGTGGVQASDAQRKLLLKSAKTLMGEKEGKAWIAQRMADLGITGPENFQLHNWQMLLNELNQIRAGEDSQVPPAEDSDIPF